MRGVSQKQINIDLFDECQRLKVQLSAVKVTTVELGSLVEELLKATDTMRVDEWQSLRKRCIKALAKVG